MEQTDNVAELRRAKGDGEETQCYVRITERDHRGFIEFQFSIGDPNLYLEMTLPPTAFKEFCAEHAVRHLTREQAQAVDDTERKWRFGEAIEDQDDAP